MAFALAPEALQAGYGLVAHETIGSTNVDALERLKAGGAGPVWVVSEHQSQGRGRRGTAWQTQTGNLAASLALTTRADPATIATLGFVAGVALVRALDACWQSIEAGRRPAPRDETGRLLHGEARAPASPEARPAFCLKWPNDVLANGAKLAGILLETETFGQARAVVIGIGVNVVQAPDELPYPTASLRSIGIADTAADLFTRLSAEWLDVVELWDEGRGFGTIRDLWLARAAGLGGPVSVRSGATVLAGNFRSIDGQGQLVVETSVGEIRTISAGDVYFGSAATARREAVA